MRPASGDSGGRGRPTDRPPVVAAWPKRKQVASLAGVPRRSARVIAAHRVITAATRDRDGAVFAFGVAIRSNRRQPGQPRAAVQRSRFPPLARRGRGGQCRHRLRHQPGHVRAGGGVGRPGRARRRCCRSPAFTSPKGVAVDSAGAVYVSDFNNRVVKLAAGSNTQTRTCRSPVSTTPRAWRWMARAPSMSPTAATTGW